MNRYSYCLNNPLIYIDPSGHAEEDADNDNGGLWAQITEAFNSFCSWVSGLFGSGKGGNIEGKLPVDPRDLKSIIDSAKKSVEQNKVIWMDDELEQWEKAQKALELTEKAGKLYDAAKGLTGNVGNTTPTNTGSSRAPQEGTPNSIYEQVDENGNVISRTFYDENGHSFARQDFNHPHGGIQPHEHTRDFNSQGQPITPEDVHSLPPGYDNKPSVP